MAKKTEKQKSEIISALVIFQEQNFRETSEGRAVATWADVTTSSNLTRARDIERDKRRDVSEFFEFCQKHTEDVTGEDVREWRSYLQKKKRRVRGKDVTGLKPASISVKLAHLSAFFEWLRKTELGLYIKFNPARINRSAQPKAYSSESVSSLNDAEIQSLWQIVADSARADPKDVLALRDYAILRLFMATGMRRSEVLGLTGLEVQLYKDGLLIRAQVKGGDYVKREISDPQIKKAILDYLAATGRADVLGKPRPLWLRHDRAAKKEIQISSHAFAARMKIYADQAGIKGFHLHQLRHTFARIVSEESGSITETQDALGHKNINTTRVYVQRVGIKKDKFSELLNKRIGGE